MENESVSRNFIEREIDKDLSEGVCDTVHTRFPPEPNGYLHIGHAKAILLNYGIAKQYGGKFNMRFDDTNPTKEKSEFVESIKEDIQWLGADWEDRLYFASDYFGQMYEAAVRLIQKGLAYVSDLSAEQMREYRGTLTEPGLEDPSRNRSVEENMALFEDMKNGKFADGEKVLRAKIDMASGNINMRDPVIYRVARMTHHNTGDAWCIYPMYDFAHPVEDAIEGITHSLCSLEFEDHRPLYEWVGEKVDAWGRDHMGSQYSYIGAVVGATYPEMGKKLRKLMPRTFFLVPGYGAQGAKGADLANFFNEDGLGAIVNSSRGIIAAYRQETYASFGEDGYAQASRKAVEDMAADIREALARV